MNDGKLDLILEKLNTIESRLDNIESGLDSIESRLDSIESRVDKLENDVHVVKLILENEVSRNIQIIAEGHMDLDRKLHDAIKSGDKIEVMQVQAGRKNQRIKFQLSLKFGKSMPISIVSGK